MKQAQFAKDAAFLASYCAKWAGDAADMVALEIERDIRPETVMRFTGEVRERLLWIERQAFAAAPPDPATPERKG